MKGKHARGEADASAKDRKLANQHPEAKMHAGQPHDDGMATPHHLVGQGAPGGTSDDDGDSENHQEDSGRGTAKPHTP